MRQSIASENVLPFPARQRAIPDDDYTDGQTRMSFRFCLAVWMFLAVAGWGALDAVSRLI
jgi:hypothetical protein